MHKLSRELQQTLRATALAPLAIIPAMMFAVSYAFLVAFLRTYEIPPNALSEYTAALVMGSVGLIFGYAFTIFYGVPVYLILKKIKMLNVISILIMSLVPAVVFGLFVSDLMTFLFMGYFSFWVAIVFWWIVPKHTPSSSNTSSNLIGAENAPPS